MTWISELSISVARRLWRAGSESHPPKFFPAQQDFLRISTALAEPHKLRQSGSIPESATTFHSHKPGHGGINAPPPPLCLPLRCGMTLRVGFTLPHNPILPPRSDGRRSSIRQKHSHPNGWRKPDALKSSVKSHINRRCFSATPGRARQSRSHTPSTFAAPTPNVTQAAHVADCRIAR